MTKILDIMGDKPKYKEGQQVLIQIAAPVLDRRQQTDSAPTIGDYSWWEYKVNIGGSDVWIHEAALINTPEEDRTIDGAKINPMLTKSLNDIDAALSHKSDKSPYEQSVAKLKEDFGKAYDQLSAKLQAPAVPVDVDKMAQDFAIVKQRVKDIQDALTSFVEENNKYIQATTTNICTLARDIDTLREEKQDAIVSEAEDDKLVALSSLDTIVEKIKALEKRAEVFDSFWDTTNGNQTLTNNCLKTLKTDVADLQADVFLIKKAITGTTNGKN